MAKLDRVGCLPALPTGRQAAGRLDVDPAEPLGQECYIPTQNSLSPSLMITADGVIFSTTAPETFCPTR